MFDILDKNKIDDVFYIFNKIGDVFYIQERNEMGDVFITLNKNKIDLGINSSNQKYMKINISTVHFLGLPNTSTQFRRSRHVWQNRVSMIKYQNNALIYRHLYIIYKICNAFYISNKSDVFYIQERNGINDDCNTLDKNKIDGYLLVLNFHLISAYYQYA